jgi:hypothetical protein
MILDFREGRFMQAKSWGRGRWLFQVRVARLMVLVAVAAVLCVAWIYHREYANIERSWVSMHLRNLHHDESLQRRRAAENLDRAEADDVARVVSGLAGAIGDPDWQVRLAAARSLAGVIRSCAANHKRALIDEIDPAPIKEAAENDPAIEVRNAAMGALFTGWPEYSYNEDVLGR